MSRDSDERLVALSVAGDMRSFERLVERHRDVVHRVASRITGEIEADDVTQDTFLRAYHRLGHYRGEGSFRAWLLRIAHNTAVTALERRAIGAVALADLDAGSGNAPLTPAEQLEAAERRRRLSVKVRGLSPQHRTVLVLRDVEGFSYDEIATVTEAPVGSVKARLHRARRELVEMLRDNAYDWELPRGR
jgi:RNA polymerase sigma-70 factor (ECF subfamily)